MKVRVNWTEEIEYQAVVEVPGQAHDPADVDRDDLLAVIVGTEAKYFTSEAVVDREITAVEIVDPGTPKVMRQAPKYEPEW